MLTARVEAPRHPALLLSILMYGYATGVFSSRKLENATYDSVAFRFVAANEHPDHDTLNSFRKRFLKDIEVLMVQVLMIARTMGMLNLGRIALDGSKLKANASKHSALSYGHTKQLEVQLQAEVKKLMALAEAADNEKIGEDAPPASDDGGTCALRAAKMYGGAGDRHHQIGTGIPSVLATRIGKCKG